MTSMLAVIQTIAMLCQFNFGGGLAASTFDRKVITCQKEYVECLDRYNSDRWTEKMLQICVRERTKG